MFWYSGSKSYSRTIHCVSVRTKISCASLIVTVEQTVQLLSVQVLRFILNPVASLSNMLVVVLLQFFSKVPG